jgi:hypothetical protein
VQSIRIALRVKDGLDADCTGHELQDFEILAQDVRSLHDEVGAGRKARRVSGGGHRLAVACVARRDPLT